MKRFSTPLVPAVVLLTIALLASLLVQPATAVQSGDEGFKPTTVILVRHAEKADAPREDPPLTEAGTARAQKLASLLSTAGVKAVYTSQFARTRLTAEPLAKQLGVTIAPITLKSKPSNPREVSEESIRQIVDKIMANAGQTALVVGHSNSVPDVIRMLGGDTVPVIDESKFDDLFIVTVYAKGKAKVLQLK
ncbi:MAG TPA: phosphoglycerate mutase family protein, partial [Pyrinomonadaceae bacterium]|nr:phosphoglycerate mutase family protein [Pyrinomonadaceae bacterium]